MWGAARRNKLNWCSAHILLFNKVGEHGEHGGLAKERFFTLQLSGMAPRHAQAPPTTELSTLSISGSPRPWGGSSHSQLDNTKVISAASGEEGEGRANHLAHREPCLATSLGCLHQDALTNATIRIFPSPRALL